MAISDFGTVSVRRFTYSLGDSSSTRGFGISIDCLDVEGRGELTALVSGELVSWVCGRAGIGGEDEKRFIDKRWRRGGFVEARARGFGGSSGSDSARAVKGCDGMQEKVVEVARCEDLGLEDRAPAVDGRPGRRTPSDDL